MKPYVTEKGTQGGRLQRGEVALVNSERARAAER